MTAAAAVVFRLFSQAIPARSSSVLSTVVHSSMYVQSSGGVSCFVMK